MKKILTLFAMLLFTASALLAQAPSLSYQMIVRNQHSQKVGDFEHYDLVYSQSMNVYVAVLEPATSGYNVVKVWAFIEGNTDNGMIAPTDNGMIAPQATTNMNGMLSLTLKDYDVTDISAPSMPTDISVPVTLKMFKNINWENAKFIVAIPEYGIMDTVDILPVPYALEVVARDSSLTTEKIVDYITNRMDVDAVNQIFAEINANTTVFKYGHDTIINYIKAHVDAVREIAFYFLHNTTPEDIQAAYDTIPAPVMEYVTEKLVEYAKNHKDDAVKLALRYIDDTQENEVIMLMDSAMSNPNAPKVMKAVRDTVVKYISTHKAVLEKAAKTMVDMTTLQDVKNAESFIKSNNKKVYDTLFTILDSYVEDYLVNHFKAVSDSCYANAHHGDRVNLCDVLEDIENLKEYGFATCPNISKTKATPDNSTNGSYELKAYITQNIENLDLHIGKYYFLLSYPNSIRTKIDTVEAQINAYENSADTFFTATIPGDFDIESIDGFIIVATPYATSLKCKTRQLFGAPDTIKNNLGCPVVTNVEKVTRESSSEDLGQYEGVVVRGSVDKNYDGKIQKKGFLVSLDNNFTKNDTLYANTIDSKCQFIDTVKMNYCTQHVYVKAFVVCNNYYIMSNSHVEFTVRGPEFVISSAPDSTYIPNSLTNPTNYLTLSAEATMTISDPDKAQLIGLTPGTYTLDVIKAHAAQHLDLPSVAEYYGKIGDPSYTWTIPAAYDNTTAGTAQQQQIAPIKALPGDTINYYGTITLPFLGSNCVLTDSIKIVRGFLCGDTLRDIQGNKYPTNEYLIGNGTMCWTKTNMRATKSNTGADITNATGVSTATNSTAKYYKTSLDMGGTATADQLILLGLLYNHKAAEVVCPKGWHLPADSEWTKLEQYVNSLETNPVTFTDTLRCKAHKLVYPSVWGEIVGEVWNGVGSIQFEAYPAGARYINTTVDGFASFWTATQTQWNNNDNITRFYCRVIHPTITEPYSALRVIREDANAIGGMSVRCVKNN